MRYLILACALSAGPLTSAGLQAQELFIKNLDRIHTAEGRTLKHASILVHKGKILAIGKDLDPKHVKTVIDGHGLQASPGIIDAHSHIAIEGGVNEGTDVVTPEVRIADVIDPTSPSIYRALAGGCTSAQLLHGSANVIGGQSALIKLKWKSTVLAMLIKDAPRGVKFALGENPKRPGSRRRGGRKRRYPATRMGVEAVIRAAFDGARSYQLKWRAYRAARKRGERRMPPDRNLRQEALVDILEGRLHIHCHCYRSDEILMMIRIADDYGIKVAAFHHALEAYRVAPEIARHGAGVATFSDWWGFKMEAYDATPYNAAICVANGVVTAIKSDSGDTIRRLNVEAAKSIKYGGLDALAALQLVTLSPARLLGIDRRTGSLQTGKDADIVLWNGDPLSTLSHAMYTIVEGVIQFDRKADLKRRQGPQRTLRVEQN